MTSHGKKDPTDEEPDFTPWQKPMAAETTIYRSPIRMKMHRHHVSRTTLVWFLLLLIERSAWAFESRRRLLFRKPGWGMPSLPQSTRKIMTSLRGAAPKHPQEAEFQDKDDDDASITAPRRRSLIKSSAAALLSALLGTTTAPDKANAGSLAILEESEKRRIEVFERNAPSVVFIDTFAEKQDTFSPNIMEVPLGTGR